LVHKVKSKTTKHTVSCSFLLSSSFEVTATPTHFHTLIPIATYVHYALCVTGPVQLYIVSSFTRWYM